MNRIKVMVFLLIVFATVCLFPLKSGATLHPTLDVQTFFRNYNFDAMLFNEVHNEETIPVMETLNPANPYGTFYIAEFDDNLPGGVMLISADKYEKLLAFSLKKDIDEYTEINGKTVPTDLFIFNKVAAQILITLDYPMDTHSSRQKVADTIADMFYNYDNKKKFSLYNPVTKRTYLLYYAVSEGSLYLSISEKRQKQK